MNIEDLKPPSTTVSAEVGWKKKILILVCVVCCICAIFIYSPTKPQDLVKFIYDPLPVLDDVDLRTPPLYATGNITGFPCNTSLYSLLGLVVQYPGVDWVPTETLNEMLCYILTFNEDLRDIFYTSRCDLPVPWAESTVATNISVSFLRNSEHTLIVGEGEEGKVPYIYNSSLTYGVRLNYPLETAHDQCIVTEYSNPNLENLNISQKYLGVLEKMVYVPVYYYPYLQGPKRNRSIDLLVTFGDPNAGGRRRQLFLERMQKLGLHVTHRNSIPHFDLPGELLDNAKILINMHQSDYRNTFEELRCLSALMRKVIVVSEISALQETIPYHKYVVWATLDDLPSVINETLNNYDEVYERIHGEHSGFMQVCAQMNLVAVEGLTKLIRNIKYNSLSKQRQTKR